MKEEMKGIYWAVILSIAVIFVTNYFFPRKPATTPATPEVPAVETVAEKVERPLDNVTDETPLEVSEVLGKDARIKIKNAAVSGSLRIKGARFDEILLDKYKQTLETDSADVELFAPAKTAAPYYAEFGWLPQDAAVRTPNADTLWNVKGRELTPQTPVTLEWNNGQGLTFVRRISLDDNYMFTIEQSVENNTGRSIVLYPYGLISRFHNQAAASSVVHEGLIGVVDNTLKEIKYKDLEDSKKEDFKTTGGWAGFSDRYWFSAFVMNNAQSGTVKFSNTGKNTYQADYVSPNVEKLLGLTVEQIRKDIYVLGKLHPEEYEDPEKNYKRGMDCIISGHGRVMEYVNVEMIIAGYSARVEREWYTHIGGSPTRLQSSTRYINYAGRGFDYIIPPSIQNNKEALEKYQALMAHINEECRALQEDYGIPKEDVANGLPLGMTASIVDKRNLRSLTEMSHQRMCNRAYWEYRQLFGDIRKALSEYSEEWRWIADNLFMPKCDYFGYCSETRPCGKPVSGVPKMPRP